jgi:hypothetical protein
MSDFPGTPIDEFNKRYCVVCGNRECVRNKSNGMIFDRRAQNWYERLFIKVPRASEDDPRFDRIREKKFININEPIEIRLDGVSGDQPSIINESNEPDNTNDNPIKVNIEPGDSFQFLVHLIDAMHLARESIISFP